MWTCAFLILYLLGMIVCGWMFMRISKNEKIKFSPVVIFLVVYFILISWIGVFALLCASLAGFNEIEHEENIENEQ